MLSCAKPPVVESQPEVQPIVLADASSPLIYFEKVIFRIAAGTSYGGLYRRLGNSRGNLMAEFVWNDKHVDSDEYNIAANDLLARTGYSAVDPTEALFTENSTIKARLRLAGVVTKLDIKNALSWRKPEKNFQETSLIMDVRLYDGVVKEVVYAKSFQGEGYDVGASPSALPKAVLDAIKHALADPEFVDMATRSAEVASEEGVPIEIPVCDESKNRSMPRDSSLVLPSVVIIRQGQATGSGVMISLAGYVVTAAHVVSQGASPVVVLHSGAEFEAIIERTDKVADLALLKIPGSRHACTSFSSMEEIDVGTEVFVMGSPFGEKLSSSITRGIISGHREADGHSLLQTDAAVNPGNSGGPLVGIDGRVLGIVVEKAFGIGVEGIGFDVPGDVVRQRLGIEWQ